MTDSSKPKDAPDFSSLNDPSQSPLAKMFEAHLERKKDRCWDCDIKLTPENDAGNGYCEDCDPREDEA